MQTIINTLSAGWEFLVTQVAAISLSDIADILIVSIILYYFIRFIHERRAGKLAVGVVFLIGLDILAQVFELTALRFLMQYVFQAGLIAILIVFQPELRSVLEKMGGESIKGFKGIREQKDVQGISAMINDLSDALVDLSRDKTGALVVIERGTKLGDVTRTGVMVNADMSPFLLKNIFFNKAPLHDGAVVIRGTRICAAGCFLPLSTNNDIIKDLGTRHRAAIGMSENSDAIVLVVSEETGTISMALEGRLRRDYDQLSLQSELKKMLLMPRKDVASSVTSKVKQVFTK